MQYASYEEFEKANKFGRGNSNDAFAQYFIGDSFLNPLTKPEETSVFLANVTFEPGSETIGTFTIPQAAEVRF